MAYLTQRVHYVWKTCSANVYDSLIEAYSPVFAQKGYNVKPEQ